jgi:hypothetical protein
MRLSQIKWLEKLDQYEIVLIKLFGQEEIVAIVQSFDGVIVKCFH